MHSGRRLYLLILLATLPIRSFGQEAFKILILDSVSNTELPLANLLIYPDKVFAANPQGEFLFTKKIFPLKGEVSFVGYQTKRIQLKTSDFGTKRQLTLKLHPESTLTQEIVVESAKFEGKIGNMHSLDIKRIENLPTFLGSVDIVKSVQFLPGVSSGNEGTNGYYVRGGSVDQNLVLLDYIPIYNSSHFFGFFSMFNPDMIKSVDFYKGGYPAHLGGRVSSIMQVNTKNEISQESINLDIGLLHSSISTHQRFGTSFQLQAAIRRTYIDQLSALVFEEGSDIRDQTNSYFTDAYIKGQWKLSQKDQLTAQFFRSRDVFRLRQNAFSNKIDWSNQLGGLEWTHDFSTNTRWVNQIYSGQYEVNFNLDIISYNTIITNEIGETGFKSRLITSIDGWDMNVGLDAINKVFAPNDFDITVSNTEFETGEKVKVRVSVLTPFIGIDTELNKVKLGAALRWNYFAQYGPFTRILTNESEVAYDTITFNKGESVSQYNGLEWHGSVTYKRSNKQNITLIYDRTYQFTHLATLSAVSAPTDVWMPSTSRIKPQVADQVSLSHELKTNKLSLVTAVFYKRMQQLIEYRNGVLFGYGTGFNFDDNFVFGKGKSYGIELSGNITLGHFKPHFSYTLSESTRSFPDINDGNTFPARFDRPHNFNIALNHEIRERKSLALMFVYTDGSNITMPTGRYIIGGNVVYDYSTRNNVRLPAYHRLDISYSVSSRTNRSKWIFAIYNLYSRANPYFLYFNIEGNFNNVEEKVNDPAPILTIKPTQVSLFPILPSITYQLTL